jgi:uncharacterized membrane protein (DUF4010 family)
MPATMLAFPDLDTLLGLVVALGLGLLIGIERERNKGEGPGRAAAGLRSFTLVALLGAISSLLGLPAMLLSGVFVALAALLSYWRASRDDPGLTTEIALLLTFLLGVLALQQAALAAALAVSVAILLAGKSKLHRFAQTLLTPQEIHDGLLLLASALIVLPLLPAGSIDPWGVLEIRKLWAIVVLIMTIGAAGHVALRVFGARIGLPLAGFVGGFVSSSATIAAMGQRAQRDPTRAAAAASAGMASSVATTVLMAVLLASSSMALLRSVWPQLLVGTIAAVVASLLLARRARTSTSDPSETSGRPFDPIEALTFAALLATVLLVSAGLEAWLGPRAVWIAALSAGLADVHAVTLSMGQLVASDALGVADARWALMLGFTANLGTKLFLARRAGAAYFRQLWPGHVAMLLLMLATALLLPPD